MTSSLFTDLARCATARAHLAGAESMAAWELFYESAKAKSGVWHHDPALCLSLRRANATRSRYWREMAAAAAISGHRWPEAERLGGEP